MQRIYIDTSVFGGYYEQETFGPGSQTLLERIMRGDDMLVLSELTLTELADAPDRVRGLVQRIPQAHIIRVDSTDESRRLAAAYIAAGVLTAKMADDAEHIALATVTRVDVLTSWNFKHIVHPDRIAAFCRVNLQRGYSILKIRTPVDVIAEITTA